jgi:uncharacterized BrkB/YihY/UPF0761 family membrane protein
MIYLKSIAAGLVAVFSFLVLLFVGILSYLWILVSKEQGAAGIGWDPVSAVSPGSVLIVLAVFVAGFLWQYRRASR